MALDCLELEQIPEQLGHLLQEGVTLGKSPLHTPCLGTISEHGPTLRTVVLRHFNEQERTLACHTDRRSSKVTEVLEDPRVSWLFYDRDRKLQLRLAGNATVHKDDDFAQYCWSETQEQGRACYNTQTGSGKTVVKPAAAPDLIASREEEKAARSHFTVIACQIQFVDWLILSSKGHRRAQFQWRDSGWESTWVAP